MRKVVIVLALVLVASAAPAGTNLVRSHLDQVAKLYWKVQRAAK